MSSTGTDNSENSSDNGNGNGNGNGSAVGSWAMWQRLVLSEMKENKKDNGENKEEINKLKIAIAVIQTKAAMAGAIVALGVTVLIEIIMHLVKSKIIP